MKPVSITDTLKTILERRMAATLLSLGALSRFAIAGVLSVFLWVGVYWAIG